MKKMTIENQRTGRPFDIIGEDPFAEYLSRKSEDAKVWGYESRWIFFTDADSWEQSREDDRREFLDSGVSGYEIHVPHDFVSGIEDITEAVSLELEEIAEYNRRVDGQKTLAYLGVLINRENYDDAQLASIEAMDYVAEAKSALIDGAFDYALYYVAQITPDVNLTETIINKVVTRINEIRAKYPDIYSVSGV